MELEGRLDKTAATADFLDGERLEDHDLAMELAKDLYPLAVSFFVRRFCHVAGLVYGVSLAGAIGNGK